MWLYGAVQKYHVYINLWKSQIFLDAENLFEHELGALNMAALRRKEERAGLLSNLGPCCKALCFRRDSAIRKQLMKNEKASGLLIVLGQSVGTQMPLSRAFLWEIIFVFAVLKEI